MLADVFLSGNHNKLFWYSDMMKSQSLPKLKARIKIWRFSGIGKVQPCSETLICFCSFYHFIPQTRVILLNWCAWFLRMKRPGEERVRSACPNNAPRSSLTSVELNASAPVLQSSNGNTKYPAAATSFDSGVPCARLPGLAGEDDVLLPVTQSSSVGGVESELTKILEEVHYIARRFRDQKVNDAVCSDWKFAAAVIDRLCLVAFCLITILCTIGILMSAPNFGESISKDFFN